LTSGLLHFHFLLLIAAQRASFVCLRPQPLNRGCNRFLIRQKRVPDRGIIVDVLRHHLQHLRKIHQRDECRIESLLLRCVGQFGAL
jgi:hypothetical protein